MTMPIGFRERAEGIHPYLIYIISLLITFFLLCMIVLIISHQKADRVLKERVQQLEKGCPHETLVVPDNLADSSSKL